ncbi:hypothetical protein GpartN1_g1953.t1 [Galdieria partita]|uniref:DUF5857 domain-containing protein n=1 Tax=Galdieria partita TaxID=83374 RepID=A0A9C7UP56_9RHOD|nr:hypothetical protein GpartN1_g1953.t1 [Galdieria partita]
MISSELPLNHFEQLLSKPVPVAVSTDVQEHLRSYAIPRLEAADFHHPLIGQEDYVYAICRLVPGICESTITKLCRNYTREQVMRWPLLYRICGCHLSEEQYEEDLLRFGLPPHCSPVCRPADVIPKTVDGQFFLCQREPCVIPNSSVLQSVHPINGLVMRNFCNHPDGKLPCFIPKDQEWKDSVKDECNMKESICHQGIAGSDFDIPVYCENTNIPIVSENYQGIIPPVHLDSEERKAFPILQIVVVAFLFLVGGLLLVDLFKK